MRPIIHLELHTPDLRGASAFYTQLLGWRVQQITVESGSYHSLTSGGNVDGGIVQCGAAHAIWVPYAEVGEIGTATEQGRELGARVLLEPREGPTGWRSVLATREGGEVALWQPKGNDSRRAR